MYPSQNTDKGKVIYSRDTSHLHNLTTYTHSEGGHSLQTINQTSLHRLKQERVSVCVVLALC